MKKLFLLALCAAMMAACGGNKNEKSAEQIRIDSLSQANKVQEKELNELMEIMNQVNAGFDEIAEAEGRITMGDSTMERTMNQSLIDDNLSFIKERLQANRDLIAQLKDKLNAASISAQTASQLAENLRRQVADLETRYKAQTSQITALEAQLRAKDVEIHAKDEQIAGQNMQIASQNEQISTKNQQIDQQGQQINNLTGKVSDLSGQVVEQAVEIEQKSQTVAAQDKELNTAWYVFGTKSELKAQGILSGGEVLKKGTFNKDYFTRIDIRQDRVVPFYSKSAELLTTHPAGSYSLTKDANGLYTLTITDPATFWSVSKYLVVKVK